MCEWGDTVDVAVMVPAHLSYSGVRHLKTAHIDACIAPLVKAMNEIGMETVSCCCGHGKHRPCINLADGRALVICEAPEDPLLEKLLRPFKEAPCAEQQ